MQRTIRLTEREADVLRLLAQGCTYSQAGATLGVSRHTVATHVKSAYFKLEVHSAAAAVMRAIELHLLAIAGSWDFRQASRHLRSSGRKKLQGHKR
jgi:DNA-binding CsgD family transcriptional regulator